MFFLSLALIGGGCVQSGYGINHLDIGARYAGVLMAITNTAGTIPGIVSPYVVGLLTNNKVEEYTIFFLYCNTVPLFWDNKNGRGNRNLHRHGHPYSNTKAI